MILADATPYIRILDNTQAARHHHLFHRHAFEDEVDGWIRNEGLA